MLRAQFGSSNYARAAADGHRGARGGGGARGGNRQNLIGDVVQSAGVDAAVIAVAEAGDLRERARNEGEELRKKSAHQKAFFQLKLDLEGKRKNLGEGNMLTYLLNDFKNKDIEKNDVNKVLRISGFFPENIAGITINDYRANQIEVLLKDDVAVDSLDIEDKLKRGGLDVIVSRFDHVEEYLMLYGLPLNSDMNKLKVKIEESIKPFVKDILEVKPCVHKD